MSTHESRIAELEKALAEQTAQLNQRTEELSVINSVQEGLVNQMDMQAIYDLVGDRIRDTFDAQAVIIATFDHENGMEHFGYAIEKGERFHLKPRPLDKLRQSLIDTRQKILINENFEEAYRQFGMRVLPGSEFPKSALYVPLIIGDKVTSYVSLQNVDKENAFSESDVRLLETLANSMSTALENARLLKETEQRTAELAVINSVQEALAKEMDIQAIYDLVGNRIRELFDAQAVGIATFDHNKEVEHIHYLIEKGERYYPAPMPLNILRKHLIATREKVLINKNFEEVASAFGMKKVPGTEQPKSALYVPLVIGERVTGYMSLQNIDKENAFSDSDVRLMETLANSMGVALENARLFDETNRLLKETEQQKAELGVINSVQEGLAKELDMQAIYDLVGNRIQKLFNAQAVIIATFDHETAVEHFKYLIEDGQRFYPAPRPYDKLRRHLIVSRQKIVINTNYEEAYARFGLKTLPGTNMTKSGVFVPLIIGDKINSYISLQNNEIENAFSESDVRLLETLANSMSVALENARLFDETNRLLKETEQRTSELAVINSVQEGLVAQMDMQSIYDLVGEKIRKIFNVQVVDIVTYDKIKNLIEDRYAYEKGDRTLLGPREPNGFRKHVINSRQVLLINQDMERHMQEYDNAVLIGDIPKSNLFVPLILRGEVNGIISLQNTDQENAFSDSDVSLLTTLANSMSVALESAALFHETNRLLKETEQRTAELSVINSVQDGLAKELDMQGIYNLVGEKMRDIFNAQVFDIVTYDKTTTLIEDRYTYEKGDRTLLGPRPLKGFRKYVFETARPLVINKDLDQQRSKYDQTVIIGQGAKSIVLVPMIASGEVNGVISLQNLDQENAFPDSDVNLLTTLANSMSVALENARLFDETTRLLKETEQRTAELAVINSVQEGLAKELNIQGIYDLIGNKIRDLFDAQAVAIATFNHEAGTESFNYLIEKGERYYPEPRPLGKLRLHLIQTRKKVLIKKQEEGSAWFGTEVVPGTKAIKSGVFVPLVIGDKITSYVSLQNIDRENAFSDSDVRLLETLANSMSVALENARLFDETNRLLKETEQRTAELAVINSVQEGLAKELDIKAIYDLVGNKIRDVFDAQAVVIATLDHESGIEKFNYMIEKGERFYPEPRPYDKLRQQLIRTKQKILINNNVIEALTEFGLKVVKGSELPKSILFVPLIAGDKVTSYVTLQNIDKENAFNESDVRLLETLANSMSVALESARHFDEIARLLKETEQRNAELAVINSVQEGLVREMDMQGIYELVGEKMREIFNAQVIDIVTYDNNTNLIEDRYAYEKGDRTLVGKWEPKGFRKHVIETGELMVINEDLDKKSIAFNSKVIHGEQPKSAVFVPLITGNQVKGMISLQNLDKENAFSDSDVRLLTTLANSMSVALESARLFDETTRLLKETEQRNAELAVINSVQESLVAQMDMKSIYDLVGEKIREIFSAQVVDIVTYDRNKNLIEDQYSFEKGDRTLVGAREPKGFRKHVIETGELLLHNNNVEKAIRDFDNAILIGEMPKSQIYVPMIAGGEVKGVISLQNLDHENAFSDSDVSLITTLANSMSVALESARLFDETTRLLKETEQRTAELAVINSVQDGLAKELDMRGIYNLVGDRVQKLFNSQAVIIASFDLENNTEHFNYLIENGERVTPESRPINKFRQLLIDKKYTIYISTQKQAREEYGLTAIADTQMPKSLLFVPLLSGNVIKGYVSLQNIDKENAFSESDIRLLETLANSMSVALENARLFDETNRLLKETEQRTAELGIINSVQEGLASKLDIQAVYDLVGDKIRDVFDTQGISISYYDRQKNFITHPYYLYKGKRIIELGFELGKGLTSHIIQTAQPLLINENASERFKELGAVFAASETEETTKSWLGVPLISGGQVNGTIRLENYEREFAYSESDVSLLQTLANSMSVALENARLFDETNRLLKETEQRTAELAVINSVQDGLAKELDMQGIYDLVGDRVQQLFQTHAVIIASFDLANKTEHFNYVFENGEKYKLDSRPVNNLRQMLINKKQTIYIETEDKARNEYGITAIGNTGMPKSLMFVPLLSGNSIKGYVSIQNIDKENAFSVSDIRLLETLANSMSVALENARLFDETNRLLKETEQRTAELAVINSVQEGLVKEFQSQGIYQLVGEKLCELFDTQTVLIRTFDHEAGLEIWRYAIEKGQRQYSDPRPFIWANRQLITTHKPILINENYVETAQKFGGSGVSMGQAPKSAVFVPMIVGDTVRGSVSLQNVDKEFAFNEADVKLLTTLTNSMGVALENARLFDETSRLLDESKQRANELSTVNNISQALTSQLNPEELIKLVGDQMKNLFKANIIYVALLDKKTKLIHFPYQHGEVMPPRVLGEGLSSKIIQTGKSLLINKDVDAATAALGIHRVGIPSASYLGVPIPVADEIIGVLSVQSTETENRFNENDERLLSTIAASVGVALRKAQLFEEVIQAKHIAEEASKTAEKANEAKSAFLSTVSHELRTPLTSVLGFAKIIRKRLEEKIFPAVDKADTKTGKTISQITENLQVVISEGERLTHLINDVLDLAKIEAGKMEWNLENVSMPEVLERAIAATTSLFDQKKLKLIKQIETDVPEISGDQDKLIQVIINLISNSVKFTDKGSVTCRLHKNEDEVIVSISDTGIGIAPEDFGAVFEQFKQVGGDTLTDKPKGTGLGLPICKEIVEHHGGRIWLESKVGKGSTFSFALPIVKPDTVKAKPIHLNELVKQLKEQMVFSRLKINGKNATILIVDDDDSIRSLLRQELSDAGYLTEEASNGKEALECIRKNRPDLIILDVMMPEINGFDVAAILKNDPQTMDIPIIVLSIVQDKARGFRIGVDRYLTKPIDTAQLFTEVGTLLEQGKSKKKVMVVDEDSAAVRTLTDVLHAKGYLVVESDGKELVEKAIATQPDIIILNSILSAKQEIVQTLRFEKGLENVLFFIYQ
jgi:GAF domain-containing protein/CheY-like chemotaxis protein